MFKYRVKLIVPLQKCNIRFCRNINLKLLLITNTADWIDNKLDLIWVVLIDSGLRISSAQKRDDEFQILERRTWTRFYLKEIRIDVMIDQIILYKLKKRGKSRNLKTNSFNHLNNTRTVYIFRQVKQYYVVNFNGNDRANTKTYFTSFV